MCADGAKEPSARYNYRNSIQALVRIARDEKLTVFSRGMLPNTVRSVLMSTYTDTLTTHACTDLPADVGQIAT